MSRIPNPFSAISEQLYAAADHLQERRLHQQQLQQLQQSVRRLQKELHSAKKQYNRYRHEERELEEDLAHVRSKCRESNNEVLRLQDLLSTSSQRLHQIRSTLLEYSLLRYSREKGGYGIQRLGHYTAEGIRFIGKDLRNLFSKQKQHSPAQLHHKSENTQ